MHPKDLVREFAKQLAIGRGTIFIGSGLSIPSGVPSWAELLKDVAKSRLGLTLAGNENLPQIAQFVVNQAGGNRGPLLQSFREDIKRRFLPNSYHASLGRMNVSSLWTTNYDTLLEQTFRSNFDVDVKASDDALARSVSASKVEIIKMHGCIESSPFEDLVVTQEDYEDFFCKPTGDGEAPCARPAGEIISFFRVLLWR